MRKKLAIIVASVLILLVLAAVPQNVCAPEYLAPGLEFHPQTLNLKSNGRWVTCYIELPEMDEYTVTQLGVTHGVAPVERAENDADYYDYWSASAHTEFVEPFVSKIYLYMNTFTGELSFFVHHNIDSNTPPYIGSSSASVRFDFNDLPAGVTLAQSDDTTGELDLTRAIEGIWGFGYNTDGGVIGDLPTDSSWSFTIDATFGGAEPMTSWVFVNGDGSEISLDMSEPVTISRNDYTLEDIDVSTVAITDINGVSVDIPAEIRPTEIGDEDGDGIEDLMVKFDRSEVQDNCAVGNAALTVSGRFSNGIAFEGRDTIRIINPP